MMRSLSNRRPQESASASIPTAAEGVLWIEVAVIRELCFFRVAKGGWGGMLGA